MKLHRFEAAGLAQFSYILSSNGDAVVIDPIRDIATYLDYAKLHNLRITHILETHIHADFASGATALAAHTGATLAISAYDAGELYTCTFPHHKLSDNDTLTIGDLRIQALHTPGHTPEHLAFLVFDTNRADSQPAALFTGDFLFVDSLGRPDLLGEEAKLGLAHALYRSLHQRIADLPDDLPIYPGHGAGSLCGAGLGDAPTSTLGHERSHNPLFQLDEETFVSTILASVPPMPSYYPRMKALNAVGAPALTEMPGSRPLAASEIEAQRNAGALLIDLRSPADFQRAHIPASISLGAGSNFPLWAGWLLPHDVPLILIGDPSQVASARIDLIRVGIDTAIGHSSFEPWVAAGLPTASIPDFDPHSQLPALLLDVRNAAEWRTGHLPHATSMPLGELTALAETLDRARPITPICASGYRASIAASLLLRMGFKNIQSARGGMAMHKQSGLPLVDERKAAS